MIPGVNDMNIADEGAHSRVDKVIKFNNDTDLLKSDDLYAVSRHPATGQRRITQTGEVILASREILIALVGERKKELLHRLVARKDQTITPATYILSHTSRATIFTEIELNSKELSFQ